MDNQGLSIPTKKAKVAQNGKKVKVNAGHNRKKPQHPLHSPNPVHDTRLNVLYCNAMAVLCIFVSIYFCIYHHIYKTPVHIYHAIKTLES